MLFYSMNACVRVCVCGGVCVTLAFYMWHTYAATTTTLQAATVERDRGEGGEERKKHKSLHMRKQTACLSPLPPRPLLLRLCHCLFSLYSSLPLLSLPLPLSCCPCLCLSLCVSALIRINFPVAA